VISRRQILTSGALLTTLGLYSYHRGLRYPRLSFEHRMPDSELAIPGLEMRLKDCITINTNKMRAIAPEPSISLTTKHGSYSFELINLANNAILQFEIDGNGIVDEEINGTQRIIHIKSAADQHVTLKWSLPVDDGFEFAVMGDTGGGSELVWTLKRAHQLGAQFLLHLGDFNYSEGEYAQAVELFNKAQLPCYISIGNHDFHDNGLIYHTFLEQLGPMNHVFELAGTRFINIDTAADFWPAHAGLRGKLFDTLKSTEPFNGEQIVFTHRPLKDPRPHDDHEIGGIGAIDWLTKQCQELEINTFMNGHVHHSAELDFQGIRQLTIGEGLGHENLVLQKQVAQIMLTKVEPGKKLAHKWVDLNMPWSEHQSPTHLYKLKKFGRDRQLQWYESILRGDIHA